MRIAEDIADAGRPVARQNSLGIIDRVTSDSDVHRLVLDRLDGDDDRTSGWLSFIATGARDAKNDDELDRLVASCAALGSLVFEQRAEDTTSVISDLATI